MKCVICKTGEVASGEATVVMHRNETSIIIKNVPADICQTCGEYYLSEDMTEQVLQRAESASAKGAEVEILRFAA
ncbi:MAG: type II toxin-antitoxin system MqsA family antitoxin [Desulfobulbaceae bacterium]|nr:type II toxin-antitoxin system MqsA family antitoxin [Desulfobulbaceae bacterium]